MVTGMLEMECVLGGGGGISFVMFILTVCLFVDQMNGDRDDGDGSSNGTMPGPEEMGQSHGDSDGQITPTPTPTPLQQGNGQCLLIRAQSVMVVNSFCFRFEIYSCSLHTLLAKKVSVSGLLVVFQKLPPLTSDNWKTGFSAWRKRRSN